MPIINGRGRVGIRKPNAAAPSISFDGLKLYLDAGKTTSYPGTGTVWTDISGNGNNGALTNGPTYSSANGGVIFFDGANDYTLVNYTIPSVSTVIIWFKQTTLLNRGLLETTTGGVGSGSPNLYVNANAGSLNTYAYNGSPQYSFVSTYLANTWYCLAITRTATSETTYLNGAVKVSKSLSWSSNSQFNIGVGFAGYFNGNISNVQVYNRALTAAEVLQNYNALLGRFYPQVSDADAQAFVVAAGLTSSVQANAVNSLVTSLKAAGIWTKMKAVYPFVGGSAASHKWNLKDPRDLDAAFRLVFTAGYIHSSTGAKPNGTSDYANTNFIPSNNLTQYNAHVSIYLRTNTSENLKNEYGCSNDGVTELPIIELQVLRSNNIYSDMSDFSTTRIITPNTDPRGFFQQSRTNISTHKVYKNGSLLATNLSSTTQTSWPNKKMPIAAYTNDGSVFQRFSSKECAFFSIGDGLTDAESASFYTIVQAYQTALGRQV